MVDVKFRHSNLLVAKITKPERLFRLYSILDSVTVFPVVFEMIERLKQIYRLEHGFKIDQEYQIELEYTMEGSYRDMKKHLEQKDIVLPTAFFADNDIIAFGAMRALKEKGIKIPQDISIIGFDDMPFCEITSPRLTTVRVFKQEMGSIAVKRLVDIIEKKDSTIQKIEISTELIIRDSVLKK